MTSKVDKRRIACYGDKIAVIEKGKLQKLLILDEVLLKNNIDEIIEKELVRLEPYLIFKTAVEKITGYALFGNRGTPKIEGELYSIHDQPIYRQWREYIANTPKLKKRMQQYLSGLKARKEYINENKEILQYEEKLRRKIAIRSSR